MADAYDKALEELAENIVQHSGLDDDEASELAAGLLRRGWTKAEYIVRFPSDYFTGRAVEILDQRQGRWVEGAVSGNVGNTVQVDTEFGPRTAGSPHTIRPIF